MDAPSCQGDARAAAWFPLTLLDSEEFLRALFYMRHDDQDWGDAYTIPDTVCANASLNGILQFRDLATALDRRRARAQLDEFQAWMTRRVPQAKLVFVLAPFLAKPAARDAIADMGRIDRALLGDWTYVSLAQELGEDCASFADEVHVGPNGRPRVAQALLARIGEEVR